MIKRILLVLAVLVIAIGTFFHINPYILLEVAAILILIVLVIAVAPFSFGCMGGSTGLMSIILVAILILLVVLWNTIFPMPEIQICTSTITYPNGTTIENQTIICP